ncbi:MAG: hypothetical protein H6849_02345 [Alphaproteobacteria bacterium]|nr:MAG: hypothetical protein H6849_02345 [Alphaproteobacteria bacterium]
MKINAQKLCSFLTSPYSGRLLVIYGPHGTLNNALATAIAYGVSDARGLSVAFPDTLTPSLLRTYMEGASTLFPENTTKALPLIGGVKDTDTPTLLEAITQTPTSEVPLICASDTLNTRSKLVKHANDSSIFHAAGVYDSTPDMRRLLLSVFARHHHMFIPEKILLFIANHTNEECNFEDLAKKIGLFVHGNKEVRPSEITTLIGSLSTDVSDLVWGFFEKSPNRFALLNDHLLTTATAMSFIRQTLHITKQLLSVQEQIQAGKSLEAAISLLNPPVLFTIKPRFERLCRTYTALELLKILSMLNYLEVQAKCAPDILLTECTDAFLKA